MFWTIQLSRVAPVWTGRWNEFRRNGKRMIPASVAQPADWSEAVHAVSAVLDAAKYAELSGEDLELRVPWMTGSTTPASVGGDDRPTLDECLFLEY